MEYFFMYTGITVKFHAEYLVYKTMKSRCLNKNNKKYPRYGGRGIKICDEWLGELGFYNFMNDMGKRPGKGYSIERVDNDGDYCPKNCKWATPHEQANNKSTTPVLRGVCYNKKRNFWYAEIQVKGKRYSRSAKNKEEAFAKREDLERKLLGKTIF